MFNHCTKIVHSTAGLLALGTKKQDLLYVAVNRYCYLANVGYEIRLSAGSFSIDYISG